MIRHMITTSVEVACKARALNRILVWCLARFSACQALALLLLVSLWLANPARAQGEEQALAQRVAMLEADLGARIGVYILDTGTGWRKGHRENERFLMASTFKSILCAAVLNQVDQGQLQLDEALPVRAKEIVGHSPVTRTRVGGTMTLDALCLATLDRSDNGAANLLIDRLGGPHAVTAFLRSMGDDVTRLDRKEPDVNLFVPGDPRDTTSPRAMAETWAALLTGTALSPQSQGLLAKWMSYGAVTQALMRPHLPKGWAISDKSGGGRQYTRNLVAMLTPPGDQPYIVALYLSDTPADWRTRNAAISELGAAVVALLRARAGA